MSEYKIKINLKTAIEFFNSGFLMISIIQTTFVSSGNQNL